MPENKLIPIPATGGVNLLIDARRIGDEELAYAKNLFPKQPGILNTRGAILPTEMSTSTSGSEYPLSFMIPPFAGSADFVYTTKAKVVSSSAGGGLYSANFSEEPAERPFLMAYQQKVYCFPGRPQTTPAYIVDDDAVTAFAFAGAGNLNVIPKGACLVNDRVVYWNLALGDENSILWSDPDDPTAVGVDVLSDNGRAIPVFDGDGDRIVVCAPVLLTAVGGTPQVGLLILKERSAYLLTGEPGNTDAITDDEVRGSMQIKKFSFHCGCASAESLVTTPYGTIWASHEDVWMFHVGQTPVKVGTKIRPALANTPAGLRYLWHAAYFDGIYRLAIMSPGQGPNPDSGCGEQWWLDMREGTPGDWEVARWWGPQVFQVYDDLDDGEEDDETRASTYPMSVDTRPGTEPGLYGLEPTYNRMDVVSYDQPTPFDRSDLEGDPIGRPIYFELHTKDYDLGDVMVNKLVQGLEIAARPGGAGTLEVEFVIDGGRDIVSVEQTFASTEFLLDTDIMDTGNFITPDDVASIDPPDTTRHLGKRVQIKLRSIPFEVE